MNPAAAIYYLTLIPSLLIAITCHEYAHARVALFFGDDTAKRQGRVTLNPLAHLDPVGTFALIFAGFGWGRPVEVDIRNLRSPKHDLFVSAAGPASNLLVAALFALPLRVPGLIEALGDPGTQAAVQLLLIAIVHYNLVLALFNFLPIYPLDGSHMVPHLLPERAAAAFIQFNRSYGALLLIGLIVSGYILPQSITSMLLGPPLAFLEQLLLGAY